MSSAPGSSPETERAELLRQLGLLECVPSQHFDQLTTMASQLCEADFAVISVADETQFHLQSSVGWPRAPLPREATICNRLMAPNSTSLVVPDTQSDDSLTLLPCVASGQVVGYAGVPLRISDWPTSPIGTLCVMSAGRLELDATQLHHLEVLAQQVEQLFELRASNARLRAQTEEAQRAQAMKSQFFATASHDMRTPLGSIAGLLELLVMEPLPGRARHYVDTAAICCESLRGLVDDTLDIARLQHGSMPFDAAPFSACELLDRVVRMLSPRISNRPIRLQVTSNGDVPKLVGDSRQVARVVMNLAANAVKFTRHGSVHLHHEYSDGQWWVTVRDTGIGIAPEQLDRIFEPFTQVHNVLDVPDHGSGLGLSICQQLCRAMGGTLEVDSQVGVGTTFRVSLPLPAVGQSADTQGCGARRAVPRVLLVEDDPMARRVIRTLFERQGVSVTEAVNGTDALEQLRNQSFALALVDFHLNDMTGAEVVESAGPHVTHTRVVALTGAAPGDIRTACAAAGITDILRKPIRLDDVKGLVERTISTADEPAEVLPRFAGHPERRLVVANTAA